MMKLKKLAIGLAVMSLITAAPVSMSLAMNTVYVAKGGGVRVSRPAAPVQKAPAANSTTKSTTGNSVNQSKTNTQQQTKPTSSQTQGSTFWGSAMRNVGLFAGGMFLGSMLGNMFGWGGTGFMSDILGMMFNILILFLIVSLGLRIFRKVRGNSAKDEDYRKGYEAAMHDKEQHPEGQTIHRQEDAFEPIDISHLYRDDDKRKNK